RPNSAQDDIIGGLLCPPLKPKAGLSGPPSTIPYLCETWVPDTRDFLHLKIETWGTRLRLPGDELEIRDGDVPRMSGKRFKGPQIHGHWKGNLRYVGGFAGVRVGFEHTGRAVDGHRACHDRPGDPGWRPVDTHRGSRRSRSCNFEVMLPGRRGFRFTVPGGGIKREIGI